MDDFEQIQQASAQVERWAATHFAACPVCRQPWASGPAALIERDERGELKADLFGIVGPKAHFQCSRCQFNAYVPVASLTT